MNDGFCVFISRQRVLAPPTAEASLGRLRDRTYTARKPPKPGPAHGDRAATTGRDAVSDERRMTGEGYGLNQRRVSSRPWPRSGLDSHLSGRPGLRAARSAQSTPGPCLSSP